MTVFMTLMEPTSRPTFDVTGFVTPDDPSLDAEDDAPDGLEEATASVLAAIAARVAENARPPRPDYKGELLDVDDPEIAAAGSASTIIEDPIDDFAAGIVDDLPPSKFMISTPKEPVETEVNSESDAADDASANRPKSRRRRRRKSGPRPASPADEKSGSVSNIASPAQSCPSGELDGTLSDPAKGKQPPRRRNRRRSGRRGGGSSPESTIPTDDLPSN